MASNPLSAEELFSHVEDADNFHVPRDLTFWKEEGDPTIGHIFLPQPLAKVVPGAHDSHTHGPVYEPYCELKTGVPVIDKSLGSINLVFTKFMALELVVALLMILVFGWLARQIRGGAAPRGRLANMLEAFLVFLRDEIARPCIGKHDADRWLPFLWTIFFFVLGLNLFGMIPWMGSATGALAVTGVLALVTFGAVLIAGVGQMGVAGFLKAQVPHMDLPGPVAVLLVPLIFVIEIMGLFIKHFVLAVRLLANMMAGHVVLAVLIAFIGAAAGSGALLWGTVTVASVAGAVALSLLELFVAFLQAYIFTFLSALFIGAAVHPH